MESCLVYKSSVEARLASNSQKPDYLCLPRVQIKMIATIPGLIMFLIVNTLHKKEVFINSSILEFLMPQRLSSEDNQNTGRFTISSALSLFTLSVHKRSEVEGQETWACYHACVIRIVPFLVVISFFLPRRASSSLCGRG